MDNRRKIGFSSVVVMKRRIIELIEKGGIALTIVREGPLLAEWFEIPFLETPAGKRYFGLEAIKQFVLQLGT